MEARNVHRTFSLISHKIKLNQETIELYGLKGSPFARNGDTPITFSYSDRKYATVTSKDYSAEGEVIMMENGSVKVKTQDGDVVFRTWDNIGFVGHEDETTLRFSKDSINPGRIAEVLYKSSSLRWEPIYHHHIGIDTIKSSLMAKIISNFSSAVRVERIVAGNSWTSFALGMDIPTGISIIPIEEMMSKVSNLLHHDVLTLTNGNTYAQREVSFVVPFEMPSGNHVFFYDSEVYEMESPDLHVGERISKFVGPSYPVQARSTVEITRSDNQDRVEIKSKISTHDNSKLTIRYFVGNKHVSHLHIEGINPAPRPKHEGEYILFNIITSADMYEVRIRMDLREP